MRSIWPLVHIVLAIGLSPLLPGIINRTKAFFGGRHGQRLLQPYYDIFKLLRKGVVYSRTTTWIFRAGPVISLASILVALTITPIGTVRALIAFPGDVIALVYFLGLARFFIVAAALDTGSSFEGMGASREMQFTVLAELAFMLGIIAMAIMGKSFSITAIFGGAAIKELPNMATMSHVLVAAALLIVLLSENARIPFDDPDTHLELTMIHEVMVLDHGGIDLGLIQFGSALKIWIFGALFVGAIIPMNTGHAGMNLLIGLGAMLAVAIMIGIVESSMARLRLLRAPQLLVTACILSFLALIAAVGQ